MFFVFCFFCFLVLLEEVNRERGLVDVVSHDERHEHVTDHVIPFPLEVFAVSLCDHSNCLTDAQPRHANLLEVYLLDFCIKVRDRQCIGAK